ncbi:MAG: YidC/Oxa1 family membrane protein insertase [bacterium]|nr:YidC/Oxa1 family membrane protein insertase [bacterium]
MISFLFGETVYRPIYNFLIFIYNIIPLHDFGVAIIVVTLVLKFLLIPLSKKQIQSQKKMQEMQPKIKEIQEKHKNDKEKQSRALMEFYKTNKTNPFSGCLPTIFQLIFLIAIYQVLFNISKAGLVVDPKELYSFVPNPGQINQYFFGIIDLSKTINLSQLNIKVIPQLILIVLAALAQYVQIKMMTPKTSTQAKGTEPDISQIMTKQMMYLGPLLTLFIGIKFPAGLALYWLVSTVFAIIQQTKVLKKEKINS